MKATPLNAVTMQREAQHPSPVGIGIYKTRHLGRDCRDPEAMDGNIEYHRPFFSHMKPLLINFLHPCDLDSGNPCRNDGDIICADTHAPAGECRERGQAPSDFLVSDSLNSYSRPPLNNGRHHQIVNPNGNYDELFTEKTSA